MSKLSVVIPLDPTKKSANLKNLRGPEIEVIVVRGNNPSKNRNIGARKAKAPIIAFINAHTIVLNNWAKEIDCFFKEHPSVDIVGGPQLNDPNETAIARASGYALQSFFGAAAVRNRYGGKKLKLDASETDVTSANLALRKRVFKKVKFDETIYPGEDPKFISDSKAAGFKIAYSPKIKVYNQRRASLRALFKQIFNYGKVRPLKEKLSTTLRMPYFFAPSLFVIYLFSLLFYHSVIFSVPLFAYLVLNIIFSVGESAKNKDPICIVLIPLAFVTIHISYGLGFLWGLILKWKK